MTSEQLVAALTGWVEDVLPEVQHVYPYVPSGKTVKLPDCVIEVRNVQLARGARREFPYEQLQQFDLKVWTVQLSFMVKQGDKPDEHEAAAAQLYDFEERLTAKVLESGTLGGRVPVRSPYPRFSFSPPLAQYEDGTVGREMVMQIDVGTRVEVVE